MSEVPLYGRVMPRILGAPYSRGSLALRLRSERYMYSPRTYEA